MTGATLLISKRERRRRRELELASKILALPTKQYGVIYADPPWRFEPYSRLTGMDRAADNHYPTMTLEEIKALPVPAAKDCVLFLWSTVPMLPSALATMWAWGFVYKSALFWDKGATERPIGVAAVSRSCWSGPVATYRRRRLASSRCS
jgi:N6-adenosine-specific RNA methylase IME4